MGSSCSFGHQFLAITAVTIQQQLLKTVRNFGSLCIKYNREIDTVKEIVKDVHQATTEDLQDDESYEAEDLPVVDEHDAKGLSIDVSNVGLMYFSFNHQLYMASFSPLNSLSEYTIDFALNRDAICTGIKVYHAGVAGKLGCLKLKSGLLCKLGNFATIYTLAECTSDLVLRIFEMVSGIIVHHAGVAAKVTFYLVKFLILFKIILNYLEMSVAECKLINFECAAEPLKRVSQQSCAPRRSGSQAGHQEDDQAEGQDEAEELLGGHDEGADFKLFFCCGSVTATFKPNSV